MSIFELFTFRFVQRELQKNQMEQSRKYNFDFVKERPLAVEGGRWEWEVRALTHRALHQTIQFVPCAPFGLASSNPLAASFNTIIAACVCRHCN